MFLPKKITWIIFLFLFLITQLLIANYSFAEDKPPGEQIIPKLPKTANDPELSNGHVYPEWGPVCQRYTYSVVYRDKEGRPPEYVKIYFNGKMIDMQPADSLGKQDYQKGVQYEYKYVPNKLGSNFYYFEASNGLGKARDSIIDSPDNGPVLFESSFDKNEIVLIESQTGNVVWRYSTGKEWVGGVALSGDGQYLAALTSKHVYFFSTASDKPLWQYEFGESSPIGGGPRGNGIAISKDGTKIIAAVGMKTILFGQKDNQPIWQYPAPSLAVAISANGEHAAAAAVKQGSGEPTNVLLFWETKNSQPIWEFTNNSNFHDVSLSADGQYLAASTGCPDRKAYIFSRNNNQPLVQSERLTFDSPVSRSKISADGTLAAFATEGGPDSSVVVLFNKDSKSPVWKYDNQKKNSSRALSITPDGQFIAAATMRGDVYLLSSKNNTPLKSWSLNTSVGALDIASDGSLIAMGGTDNQVQLLSTENEQKKISINEFVQTIDISDNGKYVAAGTGGSVYFFEEYLSKNREKVFDCSTVIEPPPIEQAMMDYYGGEKVPPGLMENSSLKKNLLSILPEGLTIAGILVLAYFLIIHFAEKFSLTHPALALLTLPMAIMLWGINRYQFNFRPITDFCASAFSFWTILVLLGWKLKIPKFLYIAGALYFAGLGIITLTYYQPFFSFPTLVHLLEAIFGFGYLSSVFKNKTRIIFLVLIVIVLSLAHFFYQSRGGLFMTIKPENSPTFVEEKTPAPSGEAACGNNLCEPDFGESKETCPKDCSTSATSFDLAQSICQKITLSNLKTYCLSLINKNQDLCQKIDDEDKNTCLALISNNPADCQKINQLEERKICYFQLSQLYNNIDYCDLLTDQNQKENCYFGLISGLYWERKNNLITDKMCQKFSFSQPERNTCQALQKNDMVLCKENPSCLIMFYKDRQDCQNFDQLDRKTCLRTVALLTKNFQICQQIANQKDKDDCLLDFAGHVNPDLSVCNLISEDFMRQQCYKNIAVILSWRKE